ncbi:MAG: family transposase, partial [Rhodospirillales bacterium]|nr:family transposase [Rhodospirillales bacterium]
MAREQHKPEEIVAKLRQVEVVTGQGKAVVEAVRAIGVTEATYYRWRAEYGGLKLDQVRRLKLLEQENGRLRWAVADLCVGEAGAQGSCRGKLPSAARRRACVVHVTS